MQKIILTGSRFGRLQVVGAAENIGTKTAWSCICDCGNSSVARSELLVSGKTSSCGCLRREVMAQTKRKHGKSKSPERATYDHMIGRCYNKNNERFSTYGARGIKVCERWLSSFEAFLSDMGPKPKGFSLERIDVNRGYEPENCKWIPMAEQSKNTTRTVLITHSGKTMCASDWSKETGIKASVLYYRASKGLPPELILRAR